MKRFILASFCLLLISANVFADSDGYGCYGDGVLAFDQAFKDRTGLYIITWGGPSGISKVLRVQLPRPHGSYSQGIQCGHDTVSILLRGVPAVSNTKALTKFKMYLSEISLKDRMNPRIVSDAANHYQSWVDYTQRAIAPLEDRTAVISLPDPNLNLNNCDKKEILLGSMDSQYTYHLMFDNSKSKSNVRNGYGTITHRCETVLLMKDKRGRVLKKVNVANTTSLETID